MRQILGDVLLRLHGPLTLRVLDRSILTIASGFIAFAIVLVDDQPGAAGVSVGGAVALAGKAFFDRRYYRGLLWVLAADADDPITTLALHEFLHGMPFRDLVVVAWWREERERHGLGVNPSDDDPPAVRSVHEFLANLPKE